MAKKEKNVSDLTERELRLSKICKAINDSAFGGERKDAVTWLGSRETKQIRRFHSGDLGMDVALGGGWPKGRFIEVYGGESGGKTTIILHAIAEHQKAFPDEDCALIDLEYTFDENYAKAIGVNVKFLIVHQPDSGEQALNVLKLLMQNGVKMIGFDSVAALTTRAELDGDIGDIHMAQQARLMSGALRQLAAEGGRNDVTVFFANQIRDKIGITWGEKTTTPAGRALRHYASIRVNIISIGKNVEKIGTESIVVSSKVKVDVKKNKTAAPFKTAEFCISFGYGIDAIAGLLDMAITKKVITKKGSWFSLSTTQEILGQGRFNLLERLRVDQEFVKTIKQHLSEIEALEDLKDKGLEDEQTEAKNTILNQIKALQKSNTNIDEDLDESFEDVDDVDDVDDVLSVKGALIQDA